MSAHGDLAKFSLLQRRKMCVVSARPVTAERHSRPLVMARKRNKAEKKNAPKAELFETLAFFSLRKGQKGEAEKMCKVNGHVHVSIFIFFNNISVFGVSDSSPTTATECFQLLYADFFASET
jgi:hypothetical protein